MNTKTQHIIISGHFSKNGNFIGTDSDEKEIHIYKAQMESKRISIENLKFPLFAIATVKNFDKLTGKVGEVGRTIIMNSNGEKETFDRLTALAVFKTFEDLISVYADKIALDVAINNDFNSEIVKKENGEAEKLFKKYFEYLISKKSYEA